LTKVLACILAGLALLLLGLSGCDTGWKARAAQSGRPASSIFQSLDGTHPPDW
jgi:hypothetical protein